MTWGYFGFAANLGGEIVTFGGEGDRWLGFWGGECGGDGKNLGACHGMRSGMEKNFSSRRP